MVNLFQPMAYPSHKIVPVPAAPKSGPGRRPHSWTAALLLPLILILASCDLLSVDLFPGYLSYEIATVDLKGKLSGKGIASPEDIQRIAILYTPLTGKRYVLAYLNTVNGPVLAVLDGENLDLKTVIQDPSIGPMLTVDMEGYLVSAGSNGENVGRLDPRNFAYTSEVTTIYTGNIEAFTDGVNTYVVQYNSTNPGPLAYSSYSPWTTLVNTGSKNLSPSYIWDLYLSSFYCEGGPVRFLMTSFNGSSFAVRFPSVGDFTGAFSSSSIFEDSNALVVRLPLVNNNGGWMTRGGAILLRDEKSTRLTRYNPDTGAEVDSFTVNDRGDTRFGFSSDGQRWALYERETGKLHLLRTWW